MEKVMFMMPEQTEQFLAALSVVQSWRDEMAFQIDHGHANADSIEVEANEKVEKSVITRGQYLQLVRQITSTRKILAERVYELTIQLPDMTHELFKLCFGPDVKFVYSKTRPARGIYDLVFAFDVNRAYRLAVDSDLHITKSFGTLVGVEPCALPNLDAMLVDDGVFTTDVMLLAWDGSSTLVKYLETNYPEKKYVVKAVPPTPYEIESSDMIVGYRSPATYIACSFGKRTVELYPNDVGKRWLSKFTNPNYQMLYGDTFQPALVWRAMEALWARPRTAVIRQGLGSRTQTGQRTSVAGLAVGLLPEPVTPE